MAIDGVWGFVYWGEAGIGIGALIVKDGKFHGCDAQIKYSGTISEEASSGEITAEVDMDIPAGVWLVGGAGALDLPSKRHQTLKFPPLFGDLTPIEVPIRPGKTMAVFKRYPDEYAYFADGFEIRPVRR